MLGVEGEHFPGPLGQASGLVGFLVNLLIASVMISNATDTRKYR